MISGGTAAGSTWTGDSFHREGEGGQGGWRGEDRSRGQRALRMKEGPRVKECWQKAGNRSSPQPRAAVGSGKSTDLLSCWALISRTEWQSSDYNLLLKI